MFGNIYHNRRVLLTGHTGFKGSWLALWLWTMGAKVTGIALDPETKPNHWDMLALGDVTDLRIDIRDHAALSAAVAQARPEIVFHLAAQPLVRRSYRMPRETWETNVMGTVNLLNACRAIPDLRAIVAVTTDKCYENIEADYAYKENDKLGGHDPYSASKAGTELVAASYRSAFFHEPDAPLLATARAGNVIGGGDWSEDRLIPDLVRAQAAGQSLAIRSPNATRPWQHVLEPLAGYLMLGHALYAGNRAAASAWNFGPAAESTLSVSALLGRIGAYWPAMKWHVDGTPSVHEAGMLQLDSGKAHRDLGWRPAWGVETQLEMTAAWYRDHADGGRPTSAAQLAAYADAARKAGLSWC